MPDAPLVTIDVKDYIADVRLNRPDRYNALNFDMAEAIIKAGQALAERKDIRVVVFSGEGPGFCSGLDLQAFQTPGGGDQPKQPTGNLTANMGGLANRAQLTAYIWKSVPVPVIAALHGVVYGGGLQIALGADIRLAAPDTRFSVMEIKWGLIPDMAFTQTARDLLPLDAIKELMFTGRIFNAEEADKLGIITRAVEQPYEAAMEMACLVAEKNPDAIRAGKKLLEESWHSNAAGGLSLEEKLQHSLIGTDNQVEAVKANLEKRAPAFD